MKRSLEGSDSLGAFMSACVHDFPSMIDEEEGCHVADTAAGEKKRRLNVEQVKALEKNFELENKLEPERKVKLAQELGLQPRQVAIWFQNRRARWKTKQLERDYSVLKSNYDSLKRNHDALKRDNDSLLQQIKELRTKLNIEETERRHNNIFSVKEEDEEPPPPPGTVNDVTDMSHRAPVMFSEDVEFEMFDIFPRADSFKERPADSSDSSAVLNEECHSPTAAAMTLGCFSNFLKMDEYGDLFTGDEACKLFADDEHWYCSDQWNS